MADSQTVLVGIVHPDTITQEFFHSWMDCFIYEMNGPGHILGVTSRHCNGPIAGARNEIVAHLLETDAEWLWSLDADATFPKTMLSDLLACADPHHAPIVGALAHMVRHDGRDELGYPRRQILPTMYQRVLNPDGTWAGYQEIASYGRGMIEVDATGCHCLLVHRSVFEKIQSEHPHRWFRESEVAPGIPAGEDITFCLAARDLGIPIYVNTRLESGHVKPFVVTSLMATNQ